MATGYTDTTATGHSVSLPAFIPFTIDYMRVMGPARLLLRQRFGNDMRNFLAALPQPLDDVMRIGMASDIGTGPRNEDSTVAVVTHFGDDESAIPVVFVGIADGTGGDAEGQIASGIAIHTVTESVINRLAAFGAGLSGTELTVAGVESLLIDAIRMAHFQIKTGTAGGSSTLTCALIVDKAAYIAHIGDCRAYLLNDHWEDMEQLTEDHRRDQLTSRIREHVLTRMLGKNDDCEVDITRRNLASGSRLFLCSNGVWENVSQEAIFATIQRADQPQDICEALVSLAQNNNAHDDRTALLAEMPG